VWQYQEFSLWLSDIFHHTTAAGENPFAARIAEARMRRLLGSPAAAAAFAELYTGKNADHWHQAANRGEPRRPGGRAWG
jgi:p-hydroxybenzoate 3-monooxygenase